MRARPRRGCRAARCGRWRARTPTRSGRARRGRGRARAPTTARPRSAGGALTRPSSSSARSATTTSRRRARASASACPTRSTPTTSRKPPARPASTPASASSKTAACARLDAEGPRAGEEGVGRRLAAQPSRSATCRRRAPRTGRRCRRPRGPRCSWRSRRRRRGAGRRRGRRARSGPSPRRARRPARRSGRRTSSFLRLPSPWTVSAVGRVVRVALGQLDPARGEERAHAVGARLAVDVLVVVVAASNGTNSSPVRSARARRNSSNICFQAAAWTFAVWVRTPSRSKRQAQTPSGRPSTDSILADVAAPRLARLLRR